MQTCTKKVCLRFKTKLMVCRHCRFTKLNCNSLKVHVIRFKLKYSRNAHFETATSIVSNYFRLYSIDSCNCVQYAKIKREITKQSRLKRVNSPLKRRSFHPKKKWFHVSEFRHLISLEDSQVERIFLLILMYLFFFVRSTRPQVYFLSVFMETDVLKRLQ